MQSMQRMQRNFQCRINLWAIVATRYRRKQMSVIPVQNAPTSETQHAVEKRFRQLEAVWEAETMFLSDAHKIIEHPAFQEIISLGDAVIPFMMRNLEKEPCQWVWALPRISGANPLHP